MFIYSKNQLGRLRVVKPLNYYLQLNARAFITTVIISRRIAANTVELTNLFRVYYKSHLSALHTLGSSESLGPLQPLPKTTDDPGVPAPSEEKSLNFPVYDFIPHLIIAEII